MESVFENISSNSPWFSVSREVGSNFIRTCVCSVNGKLMYYRGLKSLNTGRVRLTLFRNKNKWGEDENGMFGAFRSSKDNQNMFKIAF